MSSFFALNRLRIMRRGHAVYDEKFHLGVNIIRGENGSGKSTIADFIFYILGGEFESWKAYAKLCDEVQAEVRTASGILTLRRAVDKKLTPISIFYGKMSDATASALDNWISYPIHRQERAESFSQIMFRASGIPEAKSSEMSNITMHQILRLMYSDQKTPAPRLFRLEFFDTRDIREAVGGLMCGLNVYEGYAIQLRLRALNKEFADMSAQLTSKLSAIPAEYGSITVPALTAEINRLVEERKEASREIEMVDNLVDPGQVSQFMDERNALLKKINSEKRKIATRERRIEELELDIEDLQHYLKYLEQILGRLPGAQQTAEIIGNIEFTHCPSCLQPLVDHAEIGKCVVCGRETDPQKMQSRYLQLRLDFEIQGRESRQLLEEKESERAKQKHLVREAQRALLSLMVPFSLQYDMNSSPRQSFLAARYQKIGSLEAEQRVISRFMDIALEIEALSNGKAALQREIQLLKDMQAALELRSRRRFSQALTEISNIGVHLLSSDLRRQDEFEIPQIVELNFGDDVILVDGQANFAESSNVILKNTAILSLFSAATHDEEFFHPRFLLFDNVEDKGMESTRSHNFQALIVEQSKAARLEHQIIYTTSMMNPELDEEQYVIGPFYTHDYKTLRIE